jgi:hypothetical protein
MIGLHGDQLTASSGVSLEAWARLAEWMERTAMSVVPLPMNSATPRYTTGVLILPFARHETRTHSYFGP